MKYDNCSLCNKPRWTRNPELKCKNCRRKRGDVQQTRQPRIKRFKTPKVAAPPKAEKKGGKKGKEKK